MASNGAKIISRGLRSSQLVSEHDRSFFELGQSQHQLRAAMDEFSSQFQIFVQEIKNSRSSKNPSPSLDKMSEPSKVLQESADQDSPPNRVLFVTIHTMIYPITKEVLHQVFSPYGFVEKIVTVGFQALIQFQSQQNAVEAMNSLQGRCIYDGCCRLAIQFSYLNDLGKEQVTKRIHRGSKNLGQEILGSGPRDDRRILSSESREDREISRSGAKVGKLEDTNEKAKEKTLHVIEPKQMKASLKPKAEELKKNRAHSSSSTSSSPSSSSSSSLSVSSHDKEGSYQVFQLPQSSMFLKPISSNPKESIVVTAKSFSQQPNSPLKQESRQTSTTGHPQIRRKPKLKKPSWPSSNKRKPKLKNRPWPISSKKKKFFKKTKSNALNGSPKAQVISAVPPEGISRAELEEKVGGLMAYADASSNPLVESPQVPARKKIVVGRTGTETTLFVSSGAMGQVLCCLKVDQSTVATRETFGKFDDVLEPGCHFLPWIFGQQIAEYLSLRV